MQKNIIINKHNIEEYYPSIKDDDLPYYADLLDMVETRMKKVIKELDLKFNLDTYVGDEEFFLYRIREKNITRCLTKEGKHNNVLLRYSINGIFDNLEPIEEYIKRVKKTL